ncbi:MAG: M67 family metallopeptidase [Hyphomicrobiales bacterium]|nr:M67 family metallopeptidase [Hyphomicrobiales bacterium]MCP5370794.1 M67 family metallopeptidase [Hyphomicrobiales bacterium]
MITIPAALLREIHAAAEGAYPRECCGLLLGRRAGAAVAVTRVVPSRNMAPGEQRDSFEVDPQVRFDAMRAVAGTDQDIVGHYHSHPDHPARPSARDLAMAYEPALAWLITSVMDGRAAETTAHLLDPAAGRFRRLDLRIGDGP